MTDRAQMELLRIFDIILPSDISAIKACKTLNQVWVKCLHHDVDTTEVTGTLKMNLLNNDLYTMNIMIVELRLQVLKAKTEVPRDVRNSKAQKQDKFRRYWSQH